MISNGCECNCCLIRRQIMQSATDRFKWLCLCRLNSLDKSVSLQNQKSVPHLCRASSQLLKSNYAYPFARACKLNIIFNNNNNYDTNDVNKVDIFQYTDSCWIKWKKTTRHSKINLQKPREGRNTPVKFSVIKPLSTG